MRIRSIRNRVVAPALGGALLVLLAALGPATALAGGTVTCSFTDNIVRVWMTGDSTVQTARLSRGVVGINNAGCGGATVLNTKSIEVRGDAGPQLVTIFIGNGGLKPGLGDEAGSSDEIEIALLLYGGTDNLAITGTSGADDIRASTEWKNQFPYPVMNLDATETTGIDTDLLHLGAEYVAIYAGDGDDTISAAGGAGSNKPAWYSINLYGQQGADTVTGGQAADNVIGGPGADTLKGGKGNDNVDGTDGVGHDKLQGGEGTDKCPGDRGDQKTNCES